MRFFLFFLTACFLFVTVGCSENVPLGGKVVYSDDGSPLTVGEVCLETESFTARGALGSDGTYTIGSLAETDGLPPGTYRVSIFGATRTEMGNNGMPISIPLIDRKYFRGATSGLTVEAKAGNRRFDFEVDRYVPPSRK